MIIFGTRSRELKSKVGTPLFDCNHCNSTNTVAAFQTFRYFHIFWIPVFPFSKEIITQCSHCKNVKYQRELSGQEVATISSKLNRKIPLGYYFGLIIAGLFFCFVLATIFFQKSAVAKNIKHPESGDVYEMQLKKDSKKYYTLYRVVSVTSDSITFEINDYGVSSASKLDRLKKNNNYSEQLTMPVAELQEMQSKNMIYDIEKKHQ